MCIGDAEIGDLLDAMNRYESGKGRGRRYALDDAIREISARSGDCKEMIDHSRSSALSLERNEVFSLTLKDGTIIGRGLLGDSPLRDPPGATCSKVWRVWGVRWTGNKLVCLRCRQEWVPARSRPEQCPRCVGLLTISDDNKAHSAPRRERRCGLQQ